MNFFQQATHDSAVASGMVFLVKELEKRDNKLLEPLTSVTYARDMPIRTGGGFIENVVAVAVDYATAGMGEKGLIGGATNNIPIMQADVSQAKWRTFIWANILKVGYLDQEKLKNIGRSLDEMLQKGIKLAHDKVLDQNCYVGYSSHGSTGLVNNANIASYVADPHTALGTDTEWTKKTADEILKDVNDAILYTWENSEHDLSGMANHILIPPQQFAHLVVAKVGVDSGKSILNYLLENNIGKNQGIQLSINPCQWCKDAGLNGTDRMVCYANNEERIRMDITVPLRRWITQADAREMAYLTPFVAQWSEVQFLYEQPAVYVDGI